MPIRLPCWWRPELRSGPPRSPCAPLTPRSRDLDLDVPANRITAIVNDTRAITAETAVLLARRFATSAEFWMNLQIAHDLEAARHKPGRAA